MRRRGSLLLHVLTAALALIAVGCAHSHCKMYWRSEKIVDVVSWVLGTGETTQATDACGDYVNTTRDTGLSDNAVDLGGAIAEGAAEGLVPGPIIWDEPYFPTVDPMPNDCPPWHGNDDDGWVCAVNHGCGHVSDITW